VNRESLNGGATAEDAESAGDLVVGLADRVINRTTKKLIIANCTTYDKLRMSTARQEREKRKTQRRFEARREEMRL
jgi:hypothetical protein